MQITSAENKKIKEMVKLGSKKKYRDETGLLLVEGIHLVKEIIKAGKQDLILEFFYTEKTLERNGAEARDLLGEFEENQKYCIPDFLMDKISTTQTPQGLIALVKKPVAEELADKKFMVLFDNVANPDNIGGIIRSGVCFGVDAFVLSPQSADVWSPKSLRASQGAHFHTNVITDYDLNNIQQDFSGTIYGTFLDEQASGLYENNFPEKIAVCFGNEGAGISPEVEKIIDQKIYIPMENNFESLNVAAAGAVILSEVFRQKRF